MSITVISSGGLNTTKNVSIKVIPKSVTSSTASIEVHLPTQPVMLQEDSIWGLESVYLTRNNGNKVLGKDYELREAIGIKRKKEKTGDQLGNEDSKRMRNRKRKEVEKNGEAKDYKEEGKEEEEEEEEKEEEVGSNDDSIFEIFIVPEKGNIQMLAQQDGVVTYSAGSVRFNTLSPTSFTFLLFQYSLLL